MMAGIDHARGDVIVPIDADLQNDPADIPRLLAKLDEGYDVVSGWRKERKDALIRRNLSAAIANRLISRVSGVPLHDYGCTLKAYRARGHARACGSTARCTASSRSTPRGRARASPRLPVRHHAAPVRQVEVRPRAHLQGRARPDRRQFPRQLPGQADLHLRRRSASSCLAVSVARVPLRCCI